MDLIVQRTVVYEGISRANNERLRDDFAMAALSALKSYYGVETYAQAHHGPATSTIIHSIRTPEEMAIEAYRVADAMMKARQLPPTQ